MLKKKQKFLSLPLQTFGKLPFYKDYISIVTTSEGLKWQNFLLRSVKEKRLKKRQFFVYKQRSKDKPVVGIVEPGFDGKREFPFSLFVVYRNFKTENEKHWPDFSNESKQFCLISDQLKNIKCINDCYQLLQNKFITVDIQNFNISNDHKEILKFINMEVKYA